MAAGGGGGLELKSGVLISLICGVHKSAAGHSTRLYKANRESIRLFAICISMNCCHVLPMKIIEHEVLSGRLPVNECCLEAFKEMFFGLVHAAFYLHISNLNLVVSNSVPLHTNELDDYAEGAARAKS